MNANTRCKADADRLLLYSTYCTVHVHAGQKFKFRVLIAFKPRCRGCRQLPMFVHLSPITYASLRLPVYCGTRSLFHSISRRNPSPLHLPGITHVPTSTSRLETTSWISISVNQITIRNCISLLRTLAVRNPSPFCNVARTTCTVTLSSWADVFSIVRAYSDLGDHWAGAGAVM